MSDEVIRPNFQPGVVVDTTPPGWRRDPLANIVRSPIVREIKGGYSVTLFPLHSAAPGTEWRGNNTDGFYTCSGDRAEQTELAEIAYAISQFLELAKRSERRDTDRKNNAPMVAKFWGKEPTDA